LTEVEGAIAVLEVGLLLTIASAFSGVFLDGLAGIFFERRELLVVFLNNFGNLLVGLVDLGGGSECDEECGGFEH